MNYWDFDLAKPPVGLGTVFFDWVRSMEEVLDTSFANWDPVSDEDLAFLEQCWTLPIPNDVNIYYRHCNPWGNRKDGISLWKHHLQSGGCVYKRPCWPVDVSAVSSHSNSQIAGLSNHGAETKILFIDNRSRAVIGHAEGIRNYFIGMVVLELLIADLPATLSFGQALNFPEVQRFLSGFHSDR